MDATNALRFEDRVISFLFISARKSSMAINDFCILKFCAVAATSSMCPISDFMLLWSIRAFLFFAMPLLYRLFDTLNIFGENPISFSH